MQQVKDDLDSHSRPVASCLDQVRQIVASGGDVLSSDEVSTLEKNGRSLKTRYERAMDRTDRLLKRLTAACDEFSKFRCVWQLHFVTFRFTSTPACEHAISISE